MLAACLTRIMQRGPQYEEYTIVAEPRRQAFEALLRYCGTVGGWCSLVDQFPRSRKGRDARQRFLADTKEYLLGVEEVHAWPGSGGAKGTFPLWTLNLSDGLIEYLVSASEGLYHFLAPKLPEDFAVYRSDGSVLLGSVVHEHMGWMNITRDERSDPRLGLVELRSAHH